MLNSDQAEKCFPRVAPQVRSKKPGIAGLFALLGTA